MASQLKMIISVELVGIDGVSQRCEIAKVDRSLDGARLNDFGLSLEEAKEIERRLQQELTQFQTDQAGQRDRKCQDCNRRRSVHDSRYRTIHSLFGSCQVRVPRWCRCACGSTARLGTGSVETLLNGRATPGLERIQAELGSRLSFRETARVVDIFVPATRPHNHRTVSNRLGKVADQMTSGMSQAPIVSVAPASLPFPFSLMAPIFARFPAIKAGISRSRWDALLRKAEHRVSLSVRRITHILEWFHLSMRLRHIEQAWEGIRHLQNLDVYLQSVAVHVPRLQHLLWSGYVREASEP